MKLNWKREELKQRWTLSAEEWKLLKNKTGPTRLGFAVMMKYYGSPQKTESKVR